MVAELELQVDKNNIQLPLPTFYLSHGGLPAMPVQYHEATGKLTDRITDVKVP